MESIVRWFPEKAGIKIEIMGQEIINTFTILSLEFLRFWHYYQNFYPKKYHCIPIAPTTKEIPATLPSNT